MTDTPDISPEAVERLIVWLMDAHETGNTEKNPEVWRTLEALSAALGNEKRHKLAIAGDKINAVSELRQVKAERDALKAELAEAVEVVKWYGCEKNWITENPYEECSIDLDEGNCARAFLARAAEGDRHMSAPDRIVTNKSGTMIITPPSIPLHDTDIEWVRADLCDPTQDERVKRLVELLNEPVVTHTDQWWIDARKAALRDLEGRK